MSALRIALLFLFVPLFAGAQQRWVVKDSAAYRSTYVDSTQYLNGVKHGRSVLYENGRLYREQTWENGKLNGVSRQYASYTGELLSEMTYADNQLNGETREYDRNGMTIHVYNHGVRADTSKTYANKPSKYLLRSVLYYPDGKRKQEINYFLNGGVSSISYWSETSGPWYDSTKTYYPNGQAKYVRRLVSRNSSGQTCYSRVNYYTSGIPKSTGMECGSNGNDGEWKYYDTTGRLQARETFVNGQQLGWFINYYPNGKERLKTFCYKGLTDTITIYDESGKVIAPEDPKFETIFREVDSQEPTVSLRNPNWYKENLDRKIMIEAWPVRYEPIPGTVMPSYPGGPDSLNAFFKRNVVYPRSDISLGRQGQIYFTFTVQPDGTLTGIRCSYADPLEALLEKEATRVFNMMPAWKPGTENGKKTPMEFSFFVTFELSPPAK